MHERLILTCTAKVVAVNVWLNHVLVLHVPAGHSLSRLVTDVCQSSGNALRVIWTCPPSVGLDAQAEVEVQLTQSAAGQVARHHATEVLYHWRATHPAWRVRLGQAAIHNSFGLTVSLPRWRFLEALSMSSASPSGALVQAWWTDFVQALWVKDRETLARLFHFRNTELAQAYGGDVQAFTRNTLDTWIGLVTHTQALSMPRLEDCLIMQAQQVPLCCLGSAQGVPWGCGTTTPSQSPARLMPLTLGVFDQQIVIIR